MLAASVARRLDRRQMAQLDDMRAARALYPGGWVRSPWSQSWAELVHRRVRNQCREDRDHGVGRVSRPEHPTGTPDDPEMVDYPAWLLRLVAHLPTEPWPEQPGGPAGAADPPARPAGGGTSADSHMHPQGPQVSGEAVPPGSAHPPAEPKTELGSDDDMDGEPRSLSPTSAADEDRRGQDSFEEQVVYSPGPAPEEARSLAGMD